MRPNIALALASIVWQMGWMLNSDHLSPPTHGSVMTALRLHQAPEQASESMTMREAYCQFVRRSVSGASQKTITQFGTVIGLWERFCSDAGITTSNPGIESPFASYPVDQVHQITDMMLDDFARWLMADIPTRPQTKYKRSTVETYGKKIRTILKTLGPRESGNKRGANILTFVPAMAPVGDLAPESDDDECESIDLADESIGLIYDACNVARWPGDEPTLEWQVYVVCLAMLGMRVNDGAMLKPGNFKLDMKSPIKHSNREHEFGWLDYVQEKTGKRVIVPLPGVVRTHVDALLRVHGSLKLFSWSDSKSDPFAAQWHDIVRQAGLPHVMRKHLRPTANLRWTLAANDREVGQMVLGHAAADVNSKHYTRNEAILLEHVAKVTGPNCFSVDPSRGPKQLFLF